MRHACPGWAPLKPREEHLGTSRARCRSPSHWVPPAVAMGVPPPPLWRMPAGYPAGKWPFSTSPMLAVFSALRPPPRRQFSERHPCGCPRSLPAEQLLPCFALNGTPHASSSHLAPTLPHHPPPPSLPDFCRMMKYAEKTCRRAWLATPPAGAGRAATPPPLLPGPVFRGALFHIRYACV